MEKLSTTVFGQLSRKFPFRLSRMATLLTRLKPELCSTIQGRMPDYRSCAAQGRPWIFRGKTSIIWTWELLPPLPLAEVKRLLCAHVRELHDFYGPAKGYRIARKHVSWDLQLHAPNDQFRRTFNAIEVTPANSWRRWRHTSKILRRNIK